MCRRNLIEAEREIYKAQVKGKPENVADKIVEGKLEKFYSTVCLLEQGFIKNPDVTVRDLLNGKIAELGENIVIRRFVRYLVGERAAKRSVGFVTAFAAANAGYQNGRSRVGSTTSRAGRRSAVKLQRNGTGRIQAETRLQENS